MKEENVWAKSESRWVHKAHKIMVDMKKAKKPQHEIDGE